MRPTESPDARTPDALKRRHENARAQADGCGGARGAELRRGKASAVELDRGCGRAHAWGEGKRPAPCEEWPRRWPSTALASGAEPGADGAPRRWSTPWPADMGPHPRARLANTGRLAERSRLPMPCEPAGPLYFGN